MSLFLQSQALTRVVAALCSAGPVYIGSTIVCAVSAGVARRQVTFLASPRKVTKRRRPEVHRPGKSAGVPCVTRIDGPLRNSGSNGYRARGHVCARPQTVLADIPRRFWFGRRVPRDAKPLPNLGDSHRGLSVSRRLQLLTVIPAQSGTQFDLKFTWQT